MCGHRLVNGYCRTDWVLALVYRSASFSRSVAGLQPVPPPQAPPSDTSEPPEGGAGGGVHEAGGCGHLENLDVTELVKSHWCALSPRCADAVPQLLTRRLGRAGSTARGCRSCCGWSASLDECKAPAIKYSCSLRVELVTAEIQLLRLVGVPVPAPPAPEP